MEHSPDGRAYFVSHGAVGATGLANWIAGDAVYLGRVTPTPRNMDDRSAFEFYADGTWSHDVAQAKPIVLWPSKLGSVTITYDAPAKVYLMWVSRPHDSNNNTGAFDTLLLESGQITGPWRIVTTWANFGSQAYFVNVPSKFFAADGKTMWLLYSANFSGGNPNPPGSGYNFGLHELTMSIEPAPIDVGSEDGGIDATVEHSEMGGDSPADGGRAVADDGVDGARNSTRPDSNDSLDPGVSTDIPTGSDDAAGCACRQSSTSPKVPYSVFGAVLLVGAAIVRCRTRARRPGLDVVAAER
jgi:hypothetical protein